MKIRTSVDPIIQRMRRHLKTELVQLSASSQRIINSHQPISKLPVELILSIFEIACSTSPSLRTTRQGIMLVCMRWREIATSSPSLWSTITLEPSAKVPLPVVEQWGKEVERAGSRALSVRLKWGNKHAQPNQHPGAKWLENYSKLCKTMKLIVETLSRSGVPLFPPRIELCRLEILDLSVTWDEQNNEPNEPSVLVDLSTAGSLRCLMITLETTPFYNNGWRVESHMTILPPPVSCITQLYLNNMDDGSAKRLLLGLANSLEELVWVRDSSEDYEQGVFEECTLHLPKLKRLRLDGSMARYCICSLDSPLLEEVSVVDFQDEEKMFMWRNSTCITFENVRILRYGLNGDHTDILGILRLFPNITTLHLYSLAESGLQDNHDIVLEDEGPGGGENIVGRRDVPKSELLLTLSCSSFAKYPLPKLRQIYLGFYQTNDDVWLLLEETETNPGFEVHLRIDGNAHDAFSQFRDANPKHLFLYFDGDDLSVWDHMYNTNPPDWGASFNIGHL